jgi:adenylate cyclase
MNALEDPSGRFLGVVRVGLLASRLDDVARVRVDEADAADPHRVFLADAQGRLVTRLQTDQPLTDEGGDLRPANARLPEELRAALAQKALLDADEEHPRRSARFEVRGRAYLLSAFFLGGAQDWRVGVLVPEDHYTGDLRRTRRSLLIASVVILAGLAVAGLAALRSVRRGLDGVVASAARMRDFDFAPAPVRSRFRDVSEILEDLEQAKTALRALGRYVPVDLVRQLYRSRREPVLGSELRDATLLFTDIEGFTTIAERVEPDELARALGRYFEALTAAVHASGGIVDKYIGDAVMALWNAPDALPGHAALACGAALAGREETERLMASPDWEGWPRFRTRFGLHRDHVMVGHFGAPDRISYTALGDGVNLASRLEGLNRVYGTEILASEAVRDAAFDAFAFRLVDVVAVKGRAHGVRIHELLGAKGTVSGATLDTVRAYEQALEAYRQRRFDEALEGFSALGDDPPSRVLAARCRIFRENPPAAAWDGTHVAREK